MITLKFFNFFLLHLQKVVGIKKIVGYPYYIIIDPSSICQLKCPFCDGRLRPQVMMKLEDFKNIIDSIGKTCINLELYNWGEPFLNKNIVEMVNYASLKYNIYTRISSNLNIYDDEFYRKLVLSRLNSLTISLDGSSQETYEKYRVKGSFDRIINNIRLIVSYKRKYGKTEPKLVWQFLVFRHNEHEIETAKQMAKELSVNEIIFQRPNIPDDQMNWDSTIKKFSNVSTKNIHEKSNLHRRKKCNWPFSSVAINANGSVSPCCSVAKEKDDFGNVFDSEFSQIWNNDNYIIAREIVYRNRLNDENQNICAKCELKGLINFAPSFLQALYYSIRPLRLLWMKLNKFKIRNF